MNSNGTTRTYTQLMYNLEPKFNLGHVLKRNGRLLYDFFIFASKWKNICLTNSCHIGFINKTNPTYKYIVTCIYGGC